MSAEMSGAARGYADGWADAFAEMQKEMERLQNAVQHGGMQWFALTVAREQLAHLANGRVRRNAECGNHNTVGSRCTKPEGHLGEHRSQWGAVWSDESNARAAEWMKRNV